MDADTLAILNSWLLVGAGVAAIVASFGIVWETQNNGEEFAKIAHRCVIMGVALETLFSLALFMSEERIASVQRGQIISLEEKLSPRSLTATQQADITEKVMEFSGVPFDFSLQPGAEPFALMEQIGASLKAAGWNRQPWQGTPIVFTPPGQPNAGMVAFAGLEIQIHDSRTAEWGPATKALWDALLAAGIKATALRITDNSELPNAIHIKIGTKP